MIQLRTTHNAYFVMKHNIKSHGFQVGDLVYSDPVNAGALMKAAPSKPCQVAAVIGVVVGVPSKDTVDVQMNGMPEPRRLDIGARKHVCQRCKYASHAGYEKSPEWLCSNGFWAVSNMKEGEKVPEFCPYTAEMAVQA